LLGKTWLGFQASRLDILQCISLYFKFISSHITSTVLDGAWFQKENRQRTSGFLLHKRLASLEIRFQDGCRVTLGRVLGVLGVLWWTVGPRLVGPGFDRSKR